MADKDEKKEEPKDSGIAMVENRKKAKGFLSGLFGKGAITDAAKKVEGTGEGEESAVKRRLREAGA